MGTGPRVTLGQLSGMEAGRMHQLLRRITLACALVALVAAPASAARLHRARFVPGGDWVSTGIGGIPGDTASIDLSGVLGTVKHAYLYWNGMAINNVDQTYDNPTIIFDGNVITGSDLGETSSNCWGTGSSTSY